jgi:hypothetical protein
VETRLIEMITTPAVEPDAVEAADDEIAITEAEAGAESVQE